MMSFYVINITTTFRAKFGADIFNKWALLNSLTALGLQRVDSISYKTIGLFFSLLLFI